MGWDICILNLPFPICFFLKEFCLRKKKKLFGKGQIFQPFKMTASVKDLLRKKKKERERERSKHLRGQLSSSVKSKAQHYRAHLCLKCKTKLTSKLQKIAFRKFHRPSGSCTVPEEGGPMFFLGV